MFKFPMAILEIFKNDLMKMDLEQLNDFFESLASNESSEYNVEYII